MLVNGRIQNFLPLEDRSIHYGDGVFETIRVRDTTPVLWQRHAQRLAMSCERLSIPLDMALLESEVTQFLQARDGLGVLKIIISRGGGGRGYAPPLDSAPMRILQYHPYPGNYGDNARCGIKVILCKHPISRNTSLAGLKHLNRLDQVMASMELHDGIGEGFLSDDYGQLIEGIKSNIFLVIEDVVITPDLAASGVRGVMRSVIIDHLIESGIPFSVRGVANGELALATEVFICNSVMGIWPVTEIVRATDSLCFPVGDVVRHLQQALRDVN